MIYKRREKWKEYSNCEEEIEGELEVGSVLFREFLCSL